MSIEIGNAGPQTTIRDSKIIVPVDIQNRLQGSFVTQNAVLINAGATNNSAYFVCEGFNQIKVNTVVDVADTYEVSIHWSNDGIGVHGQELKFITNDGSTTALSGTVRVGGKYFRVSIKNTSASNRTGSSYAYLT